MVSMVLSVLQRVAVCHSMLQGVAVCCACLHCAPPFQWHFNGVNGVKCVAACCSVLQDVVVYCSMLCLFGLRSAISMVSMVLQVLQCVAVCYACLELQCVAMFVCPCVSVSVRVYMT